MMSSIAQLGQRIAALEARIAALEAKQATTETILHACGALAFMGMRAAALDAGMPSAAETFERILPLLGARVSQNVALFEELMELLQAAGVIDSASNPRPGGGPALRLVREHVKP